SRAARALPIEQVSSPAAVQDVIPELGTRFGRAAHGIVAIIAIYRGRAAHEIVYQEVIRIRTAMDDQTFKVTGGGECQCCNAGSRCEPRLIESGCGVARLIQYQCVAAAAAQEGDVA